MKNRKKLGEMMTESGLVKPEQVSEALADQWQFGGRLGTILIDKCMIDEKNFLRVLSEQLQVPAIILQGRTIPERVMRLVSKELAWKYMAVPVETKIVNGRKTLLLGMADPTDAFAIGVMEKLTGHRIEPALAFDNTIRMALMEYYDNQYGRGDLTLRRRSEPDECELQKIAVAVERKPIDVSAFLGEEPADLAEPVELAAVVDEVPNAEEVHDRLSLELQAMLRLLVKKGLVKPEEYAAELREMKLNLS